MMMVNCFICLIVWIWGVFQNTITVKVIAWLLPCLWELLKAFFCGKYWFITCFIPYAILIEYWRKIRKQKDSELTNVTDCETTNELYSPTNAFSIIDTAPLLTAGEGSLPLLFTNPFFQDCIAAGIDQYAGDKCPPLLPTNPFLHDCIVSPLIDTSTFLSNNLVSCAENELYCKDWIELHREYFASSALLI